MFQVVQRADVGVVNQVAAPGVVEYCLTLRAKALVDFP